MCKCNYVYFVLLLVFIRVVSPCQLDLLIPYPLFAQNFGSKKVIFTPQTSSLQLQKGESVTAYCSSGLMYKKIYSDRYGYNTKSDQSLAVSTAEFDCDSNNVITAKGLSINFSGTQTTIFCASQTTYELYESKRTLPNCEKYTTYAIGAPFQGIGNTIKAGVCYDLDHFELKFVSFMAHSNDDVDIFGEKNPSDELGVELSQKVGNLKNYYQFLSQTTFDVSRVELRKSQTLFDAFDFDLDSLLQDESLKSKLDSYAYLLNTMWWRQLRKQNWRRFLEALSERTRTAKYLVYMGTHGNIQLPSMDTNCSSFKGKIISIGTEKIAVAAPAYIWAYVKPTAGADEEDFVIIAHNSPYVTNPGPSEFCEVDVCDEVEWLKNSAFGNLRHLATLGYMFCCRPEEVAQIIDYFPLPLEEIIVTRSIEQTNVEEVEKVKV
ncbi:uncharacterized protein LOC101462125 [Ceratitis capitata]|uniref:uncharacterized protein LOC101462125 n=1 Tax=Ceratitis capitata TaxID=7213 RepID=UPI000329AE7F|nr:uncharacterized protein LOC101462125 [Ceratitis capitata]